jgi:hypothetical protein
MVREIVSNLYKVEISLLESPLKTFSSRVINGEEQNLIMDGEWGQEECRNAMQSGLSRLLVNLGITDFKK